MAGSPWGLAVSMRQLETKPTLGSPLKAVMDSGELIVDEGTDNPQAMQDALGSALAEIPLEELRRRAPTALAS